MNKKGQLTLFIIIGLLLLVGTGTVIYLTTRVPQVIEAEVREVPRLALERTAIADFVTSCLRQVGTEGIHRISSQGGYLNPSGDPRYGEPGDGQPVHYFWEQSTVPYVVDGTNISLRSLAEESKMLGQYVAVALGDCLDMSAFEQQGYAVRSPDIDWQTTGFDFSKATVNYSSKPVNVSVVMTQNDVILLATYPLLFQRGDESLALSDFTVTIPFRFALLHGIAQRLASAVAGSTSYNLQQYCTNYVSPDRLVNIYTKTTPYLLDHIVRIVDALPLPRGSIPLRFNFAMKNVRFSGACVR